MGNDRDFEQFFQGLMKDLKVQFQRPLDDMMQQIRMRTPIRTGYLISNWHRRIDIVDGDTMEWIILNPTKYAKHPAYYDRDGRRYPQGKVYHDIKGKGIEISKQGSFTPVAFDILNEEGRDFVKNIIQYVINKFKEIY